MTSHTSKMTLAQRLAEEAAPCEGCIHGDVCADCACSHMCNACVQLHPAIQAAIEDAIRACANIVRAQHEPMKSSQRYDPDIAVAYLGPEKRILALLTDDEETP